MAPRRRRGNVAAELPGLEEILSFIDEQQGRVSARDIARAFGIRGKARLELRRLLRQLRDAGHLPSRRPGGRRQQRVPPVAVIEVTGIDEEGELVAECAALPGASIRVLAEPGQRFAPGIGDRLLARLEPTPDGLYEAHPLKLVPRRVREVVGAVRPGTSGLVLVPANRRDERQYRIIPGPLRVEPGDLVRAELVHARPLSIPEARVVERFGKIDDPHAITPAVAAMFDIPRRFPEEALELAASARAVSRRQRRDLRDVPLVTIDGEDARDFDDAVWAEPDPEHGGGYRLVVAIADVAYYVRPGDALDEEARRRGNSVYFPDRAIPMLPEALSNELCSLKPDTDRACVAVEMRIDRLGHIRASRVMRGVMRSRARLTYTQVQAAREGQFDNVTAELWKPVLEPLFDVYRVLRKARDRRGCLDVELPERRILFDERGFPKEVRLRPQLESNRLIEECMIAANVAVATLLTERRVPFLYRVHDLPDPAKLEMLADYLERLGIPWSRTARKPGDFTRMLESLRDSPLYETVASFVLRAQAQAVYQPGNIGHFGLNLRCYTHFTSPIRRYSDLTVHRALIRVFELGPGGERKPAEIAELEELGRHLSARERLAMEAERTALQRFILLYLREHATARFTGRVTGVQYFGLFVTLDETGADGLVPVQELGDDVYLLDERHHVLVGRRSGESFGLGDRVEVVIAEIDDIRGLLQFRIEKHEPAAGTVLAKTAWKRSGPPTARMQRRRVRRR